MFRREDICVTLISGDGDFLANLSEQFLPPVFEFFRFRQPALNYVVISNLNLGRPQQGSTIEIPTGFRVTHTVA